LPFKLNSLNTN